MTNRQSQEENKASRAYYCGIAVKYFLMHINWQTYREQATSRAV